MTNEAIGISQIFDLIPELNNPRKSFSKNELYNFLERKIYKLSNKIKISPYLPHRSEDKFNVTKNFPNALVNWLSQFPKESRLGFLIMALSIIYITDKEMDEFLDIGIEKLTQFIIIRENLVSDSINGIKIIPFALSNTEIYDRFIHKMKIAGASDFATRPSKGNWGDYLDDIFLCLRTLAEQGKDFTYFEDNFKRVRTLISAFLDSYVVLVDDSSFSGATMSREIKRLLRLIEIIFEPYKYFIDKKGYKMPFFIFFTPISTKLANDEFNKYLSGASLLKKYSDYPNVAYSFDNTYRIINELPQNIIELREILRGFKLFSHLKSSMEYFHSNFSYKYWIEDTNIAKRAGINPDECVFGFANCGYTIVTWRNSPNDALPPIWYPIAGAKHYNIIPLFQRVESHINIDDSITEIRERMQISKDDKKGYLRNILEEYYRTR